ncbi:O-acetyl-ADP-ribose deacetylase [Patescibacteria group bacterium]|nr:O-acetyl-ADP-ribose deacetylase [Patescibacteria group bacterium]MCL5798218.1 O-acetyl-ADP-ribose deacetylase [Patescibacteria group bacterium]
MFPKFEAIEGDITEVKTDAIVNAANTTLFGGGGVDGAIHAAAGPGLLEECKTLGGCPTGDAKITKGYKLPARFVIHTVGPVWKGGVSQEAELLKSCYINSLSLADRYGIKSIAFPAIATGAFGFPKEEAAQIAVGAVREYLPNSHIGKVVFVLHGHEDYIIYSRLISDIGDI